MQRATDMWTTGTLGALLTMTMACASTPAPTTGTPAADTPAGEATVIPTPAGPAWAKEGATFSGPPAGGRGGSYRYTLCPGGDYMRWCLDADCERGTWRVDANAIIFLSNNPEKQRDETRLELSDDGKMLGPPDVEGGPLTLSGPPENCGG